MLQCRPSQNLFNASPILKIITTSIKSKIITWFREKYKTVVKTSPHTWLFSCSFFQSSSSRFILWIFFICKFAHVNFLCGFFVPLPPSEAGSWYIVIPGDRIRTRHCCLTVRWARLPFLVLYFTFFSSFWMSLSLPWNYSSTNFVLVEALHKGYRSLAALTSILVVLGQDLNPRPCCSSPARWPCGHVLPLFGHNSLIYVYYRR